MVNAVKKKHITKTAANNKPLKNAAWRLLRFSKERRDCSSCAWFAIDRVEGYLALAGLEPNLTFHWFALAMPMSSTVWPVGTFLST